MNFSARPHLFSPLKLGALDLQHRVFLSSRPEYHPSDINDPMLSPLADYYAARTTRGGLVLCSVSSQGYVTGKGGLIQLGLQTAVQVNRWRRITDAIRARGGLPVARVGEVSWFGSEWPKEGDVDQALDSFRTAAENAGDAGFAGVELVAPRGSLHDIAYSEILLSVLDTLCVVWPTDRVGLGIALPYTAPELDAVSRLLGSFASSEMAYMHLTPVNARLEFALDATSSEFRSRLPGGLLVSGEWSAREADAAVCSAEVDAVGPLRDFASDAELPQTWRTALEGSWS